MLIDICTYCGHNFVPSNQFRFFCSSLCWDLYYDLKEKRYQWRASRICAATIEMDSVGDRPAVASCVIIKSCTP